MFHFLVLFWLFLPSYSGAEESLQWPQVYHFKATLKIPSAKVVEPYEVWSDGVDRDHRYEFYNGMTKMYQKRRGVLQYPAAGSIVHDIVEFDYFWVRPDSNNINQNQTICYQLQIDSGEVQLLSHYIPPIYNFNLKAPDVNQTTKWEFSYTEQKYGADYVYNLWTTGTTNDWVPVKYEYRMIYGGIERDFIQLTYEYFNRAQPDSKVYQIPHDLRCKSLPAQYSDEEGLNSSPARPILRYDMAELFERFKIVHNKQYPTNEDHIMRFTAFLKNFRYIQTVNRQHGSYKLAVNRFTDLTEDELLKLKTGTKVEPEMIDVTHSFQDNDEADENDEGFNKK